MKYETIIAEMKWTGLYSFAILLLWSIPSLSIRLLWFIPALIWLNVLAKESSYKLVIIRLICAVVASLVFIFVLGG